MNRTYRIGTDNAYPYHFLDDRGDVHGMAGEIVQEAARRAGVRLEWKFLPEGPHSALLARKVDLWPLLGVQRDVWPQFYFTRPYLSNTYVSVATDPHFASQAGLSDVRRVASARFPLVLQIVGQTFPGALSNKFPTRKEALAAVCGGLADVTVLEARTLQQLALERPSSCGDRPLFTAGVNAQSRPLAVTSLPETSPVADLLRREIDRMLADGTVGRVMRQWSYFYGGEANTLFREAEATSANHVSYWLAGGLTTLSSLLLVMLIHVRRAKRAAVAADAAKSIFLANMSHEIRTPLNGVIGMTELSLALARDEEQKEYLGIVRTSANALLRLLNDILDLSRIEAGKLSIEPVPLSPADLIREVVQVLSLSANAKGLSIRIVDAPDIPRRVLGDSGRLRQVLINLVGNAVKFTESGGVEIRLYTDETRRQLWFAVRDTGIGIPADKQPQLFRPFTQADGSISRRFGGSGLGLAISAKLIGLMGGTVRLQSTPGRGTLVEFSIPCRLPNNVEEPAGLSSVWPRTAAQKRILLAEDNTVNQKLASRLLEKAGHTVVLASDGKKAIALLERERFDIVLMDVQMPGMDGFEATALIRAEERNTSNHIPVVAMTAHAMEGYRERCLAAGMDGYVCKPLNVTELLATIDELTSAAAGT